MGGVQWYMWVMGGVQLVHVGDGWSTVDTIKRELLVISGVASCYTHLITSCD